MNTAINLDGSHCAFHAGALRPIVVEADSWGLALLALAEELHRQEAEEYAREQQLSHLSITDHPDGRYM